jgi:hypothetical protein
MAVDWMEAGGAGLTLARYGHALEVLEASAWAARGRELSRCSGV